MLDDPGAILGIGGAQMNNSSAACRVPLTTSSIITSNQYPHLIRSPSPNTPIPPPPPFMARPMIQTSPAHPGSQFNRPFQGPILHPIIPGLSAAHRDHDDKSGPVGFSVASLPLPCAYIRLPWPRGRPFARLLPAKSPQDDLHPAALVFRQYIKRMMVEEICFSPPTYILRYIHTPPPLTKEEIESPIANSRLAPFVTSRRIFPPLQALCCVQSYSEMLYSNPPVNNTERDPPLTLKSILLDHPSSLNDKIALVFLKCPPWRYLPLNYRLLESLWIREGVPAIMEALTKSPSPLHLVVAWDTCSPWESWAPHNMRQVVHLVAQTVSVLSSCIPLLLQCSGSPSRGARSMASLQIVVFPCRNFSLGVNAIRQPAAAPGASTPVPPHQNKVNRRQYDAHSASTDEDPEDADYYNFHHSAHLGPPQTYISSHKKGLDSTPSIKHHPNSPNQVVSSWCGLGGVAPKKQRN